MRGDGGSVLLGNCADKQYSINARCACGKRLAQRASGQQQGVTEAGGAIHNDKIIIVREGRVLKPVIFDGDLRAIRHSSAQGLASVAGNINGQLIGQHERFIACLKGAMAGRVNTKRASVLPAKPARQHNWLMACAAQQVGHRANRRGFASPANGQIADANYRNFRFFRLGQPPPQRLHRAIDQR